jgi:uncharacterized repeat protein (TIGR03803 family)
MAIPRLLTAILICSAYGAAQSQPRVTTLYNFTGAADGSYPSAQVVIGSGGVLYGTTYFGGAGGQGTAFSLTPPGAPGDPWIESTLFSGFGDGGGPNSRLAIGSGGVLYGTTVSGGIYNVGMVFSLTPPSSPGGDWIRAVLHNFNINRRGDGPAGVVVSAEGILYGTCGGGEFPEAGTVFALVPPATPGVAWPMGLLYTFSEGDDGYLPGSGVVIGSGGTLYGTTVTGGSSDAGTVYALTPPAVAGGSWTETVLYSFMGGADGFEPIWTPVIGSGGVLYGTTSGGGSANGGTVFSLTPPASAGGSWTHAVLYNFPTPQPGPVTLSRRGVLYGMTNSAAAGTAFALEPPASPGGSWTYRLLGMLAGSSALGFPTGFTIDEDGVLYGTVHEGGTYGYGMVFALTP